MQQPSVAINVSSVDSRDSSDSDDEIFSWNTCTQQQCEGHDYESSSISSSEDHSSKSAEERKTVPSRNPDPHRSQAGSCKHYRIASPGSDTSDDDEDSISESNVNSEARKSAPSFDADTSH